MKLSDRIAELEAELEHLRRMSGKMSCAEAGDHVWQSIGGANAGCCEQCVCSVPVRECLRCGECDYGENEEATRVRMECNRE